MSHNSRERFPNPSLAISQQTLFHATETLSGRHWASTKFPNTKICRLGIFTHVKKIYRIKVEPRDVRLSNLASPLSTYIINGLDYLTAKTGTKGRVNESDMTRPTHAWAALSGFYKGATKREALDTGARSPASRQPARR